MHHATAGVARKAVIGIMTLARAGADDAAIGNVAKAALAGLPAPSGAAH